jgi:acyl-CoA hydrolase
MPREFRSASEAVEVVKSGDRVFVHGSAATPISLVNALLRRAGEITDIEIMSISTYGNIEWNRPEVLDHFRLNSLFVSENVREWANGSSGEYVPVFLSEIPQLFERKVLPLDVTLIQVSPPDAHGYCTLGTSVDAALSAVRNSNVVIAQINPRMPRVLGDGIISLSDLTGYFWEESELHEVDYSADSNDLNDKIARHVSGLIDDGSTLQMGVGSVPDAVLRSLSDRKGLGIHTETFSDGVLPLIEKGVITNEHKKVLRGKVVTSFILGTRKVYDFVDNNPSIACLDVSFVNDTDVIRRNPKVVSINSAIEIDITGQICADSIGTYQYSGIGGQMDFMRGAALSEGGKPVIAMPSITRKGISRIVPTLKDGAGVVTTRGHVHYVATEYGVVDLYGKNMEQRAALLTKIAHPDHQETLERAYFHRFGRMIKRV